MDIIGERARYLWGGILLALLILSLALFLLVPGQRVRRVLFFPGTVTPELSGEVRYLPRHASGEESIRMVLDELLLGPLDIGHERLLPASVRIRSFLYRGGVVYLDFDHELISSSVTLDAQEMLGGVERTIRFNFPSIDDVVITISGQIPFAPYYEAPPIDQNGQINKNEQNR